MVTLPKKQNHFAYIFSSEHSMIFLFLEKIGFFCGTEWSITYVFYNRKNFGSKENFNFNNGYPCKEFHKIFVHIFPFQNILHLCLFKKNKYFV